MTKRGAQRSRGKGAKSQADRMLEEYKRRQRAEVDKLVDEIMGRYCEALLTLGVDETTIVAAAVMIGAKDTREYIQNAELPKLGEAQITVGLTTGDDSSEG